MTSINNQHSTIFAQTFPVIQKYDLDNDIIDAAKVCIVTPTPVAASAVGIYKAGKSLYKRHQHIKEEQKLPKWKDAKLNDVEKYLVKHKIISSKKYTGIHNFISGFILFALPYWFIKKCCLIKNEQNNIKNTNETK